MGTKRHRLEDGATVWWLRSWSRDSRRSTSPHCLVQPSGCAFPPSVDAGCLLSAGPDFTESQHRADQRWKQTCSVRNKRPPARDRPPPARDTRRLAHDRLPPVPHFLQLECRNGSNQGSSRRSLRSRRATNPESLRPLFPETRLITGLLLSLLFRYGKRSEREVPSKSAQSSESVVGHAPTLSRLGRRQHQHPGLRCSPRRSGLLDDGRRCAQFYARTRLSTAL